MHGLHGLPELEGPCISSRICCALVTSAQVWPDQLPKGKDKCTRFLFWVTVVFCQSGFACHLCVQVWTEQSGWRLPGSRGGPDNHPKLHPQKKGRAPTKKTNTKTKTEATAHEHTKTETKTEATAHEHTNTKNSTEATAHEHTNTKTSTEATAHEHTNTKTETCARACKYNKQIQRRARTNIQTQKQIQRRARTNIHIQQTNTEATAHAHTKTKTNTETCAHEHTNTKNKTNNGTTNTTQNATEHTNTCCSKEGAKSQYARKLQTAGGRPGQIHDGCVLRAGWFVERQQSRNQGT